MPMRPSDVSEGAFERRAVALLTGRPIEAVTDKPELDEGGEHFVGPDDWIEGRAADYDAEHALDIPQLVAFLQATQPDILAALDLDNAVKRRAFLARLAGELTSRGVVDVLRKGVRHLHHRVRLYYPTPTSGNLEAARVFAANRFSVTRQVRYSRDETRRALDLVLFVNGLPVATVELKNSLTRQTWRDAVEQYKRDRDPREPLLQFGRCVVHFAVDDVEAHMCTELKGKDSWFLPFNRGWNDGAGNPPDPSGVKTDYLWRETLAKRSLANILEAYAQIVERRDERGRVVKREQIFPRYHQLDVVRRLLADVGAKGAGQSYLIQHSAGSGKSNSIAWLAHQLVGHLNGGQVAFDSIVVVTDRTNLDKQITATIKQFAQVDKVVGHADRSGDLKRLLEEGKSIIITLIHKFPLILDEIGNEHRGRRFALLIDEAHSSQGGGMAGAVNQALSTVEREEEETVEDRIVRMMEGRRLLPNASYFAFTATPKNKTLEIFGAREEDAEGVRFRPFHVYTMKQAIQERFIMDVLASYTPVRSWYRLASTVEEDPEYDARKAMKKLRAYVEGHDHAIRKKAEIMIDHFHDHVLARRLVGGKARALVATGGIERAIAYFHAFNDYLAERKSPWKAIVAFSGEHENRGVKVTEASLNGFPANKIEAMVRTDPYRFLIVADKFLTGYDEPLLHTMYVDKPLSGVKAVQTLSRLNRAHPQKSGTFVLDFMNETETIVAAFAPYYRTTVLSGETDPNRLNDLERRLEEAQVFTQADVDLVVERFLSGADRGALDPLLDACAAAYGRLDEDGQIAFKGDAKAFVRTYGFLAMIMPAGQPAWEKLATFLNLLIPKLPAPREEDLAAGVLDAVDMDSYRAEVEAAMAITLADADGPVEPVTVGGGGERPDPQIERLSVIIEEFNAQFANLDWTDADRVRRMIDEELPAAAAADSAFRNARENMDRDTARLEFDAAFRRAMNARMGDEMTLYKVFMDNPAFRGWLLERAFDKVYFESRPGL
ncbi:type I restriction endonuclease subunit R [Salinarimonas ramus]|uniref:Helicase ATP-binding domain-containing protein n=1 Tax=Salinarimonas ramus TaxID=690164 RepID=A0A917QHN5_9HYPH|nr:type I restriction endonuclease subunit R [Salinarimonas ramus]GGK51750.1 hypothetical protein GCM10011322_43470 [Salinarimonas ramus]